MAKESSDGQEKSEQPTAKRLSKSRGDGQVARSQEINSVAVLFAALLYFVFNGGAMIKSIRVVLQELFGDVLTAQITVESSIVIITGALNNTINILLPFLAVLMVTALLVNLSQIGFLFTLQPLTPKLSRFNILKGLKNKVSAHRLVDLLKSMLKLIIAGIVPYLIIKGEAERFPLLMDMEVVEIMSYIGNIILRIIFFIALVMLVPAVGDLIYQRWKHKRDLMMTKQEVRDELKQAEGDPKIKARIRSMQAEFMRKMMLQEVPKADVVVTNPIHLAVALKYDRGEMTAPKVVAKGARLMAEKIKEIARENNVPIIENKPLAQSLYKEVEVGDNIPESLFRAVAEILAYVYRRKNGDGAAAGY